MRPPATRFPFSRRLRALLALALLAAGGGAVLAQDRAQHEAPAGADDSPAEERPAREWLPEGVLYEPYLAEIRRPGLGAGVIGVAEGGAADSGDLRFGLKLGGAFGLLRLAPRASERLWQLSLEAGFYGQFDIEHSLDNLGWDGLYGLTLTSAREDGRGAAVELAVNHISSHVGDEYAERTGRLRIGYTREEVAAGVSWRPGAGSGRWRTYAEAAWAHVTRNEELQDPGRFETGVEYDAPGVVGRTGRWGTYAALDLNLWEERGWRPSVGAAAGLRATSEDRIWRLGLALYDGQVPIGEFFQDDERYVIVGAWLDLERGVEPAPGPETEPQRPNRLAGESSPYLLLHADDPVDWYPWGPEAIARAREEGRPIFLSVGYTACYWCHVMAREVFADPEIAALMNRWFVNVKVDREERPDVDEVYIAATQLLTGGAGWPNSVFLTPELEPFFAGTYFPPAERGGRPGFPSILRRVHADWTGRPAEVREAAGRVAAAVRQVLARQRQPAAAVPAPEAALAALSALGPSYDPEWGGFARPPSFRPKFPSPGSLFLLLEARDRGDEEAGRRLDATLRALGRGAIHDQLAGGFHRYTVDREWRVPHFEKMLADNALLLELLAESLAGDRAGIRDGAAPVASDPELARLARRTADFLLAEMALPAGGFRSSLDAETEGEEGRYYTWTGDELRAALGAEGFALLAPVFGFDDAGELPGGRHTLHWTAPPEAHAARLELTPAALHARLEPHLAKLRAERERRSRPRSDDKLLADGNGLAIAALARAGEVLEEPRYRVAAERAAERVLGELGAGDELRHARRGREGGGIPAFLDDYAHLAHGLLALHRASGEARWLTAAAALADEMEERLGDPAGGWFHAAPDPHLLFQPKSVTEGSIPAGNAVAVLDLLELAARLGRSEPERAAVFRARAEAALRAFARDLELHPAAVPTLARALLRYAPPPAPAAGSSGA